MRERIMGISVSNIRKSFGSFTALKDVTLDIKPGELVALLGPSGSGKTTLLRIIAGLERADSGRIMLQGEDAALRSVRERQVGFMFQHYALFKHMTVFDNVAFGLRVRKRATRPAKKVIEDKVLELLRLVHLQGLHDRYPAQLSGGQRQRVALARALVVEPRVLLLDEPFGALDAKVRKELRRFMRQLHETIPVTTVFVTHDQEEAMEVADRVVVMSNGAIEQIGTPSEVWHQPVNGFVYDFLGNYNEFEGWRDSDGRIHLKDFDVRDSGAVETAVHTGTDHPLERFPRAARWLGRLAPGLTARPRPLPAGNTAVGVASRSASGSALASCSATAMASQLAAGKAFKQAAGGKTLRLVSRPHELQVLREPNGEAEYIAARILHINPAGPLAKLELQRRNGNILQAEVPAAVVESQKLERGQNVLVRPIKTRLFE
jgi:sulfate transport system ATP-binding protein